MLQRLNRAEYAAAIRSLFGLEIDADAYLPADTISASFDNIADVQTPSATVLQGYMRAAAHVSRLAVGDPSVDAATAHYDVPRTRSQKDRVEGAPFGTRGGVAVTHTFPSDGTYRFQLLLHGEPTGMLFGRTIGTIQIDVSIDGERVALVEVDRWISESDPAGLTVTTPPIWIRAGPRRVAAAFLREFEGTEDDFIKPIEHTLADTQIGVAYGVTTLPHLRNLAIAGPFEVTGVSDHPSRRAIFRAQVRRMLADPRSEALATRFAAQWLRLQDLDKVEPDAGVPGLRPAARATRCARDGAVLRQPGPRGPERARAVTADYTFVNERLARHYGIPGVSGEPSAGSLPGRHARGPPRPRQRPDADLARQPHLAGAARQVGDGGAARHAAAAAAARACRTSRRPRSAGGRF
jgi:hypothetical protein